MSPRTMTQEYEDSYRALAEDSGKRGAAVNVVVEGALAMLDELDATREALDTESQRVADLKHQLGEYADKLDCMVDPEEHRQKLAVVERERDEAQADAQGYRNGQAQVQATLDTVMETNTKMAASIVELESLLCVERKAANHWMGEATKAHNDGCHVADEMRIALAASQAECAELREALEYARRQFIAIAGPNDLVLSQFDSKLRREWWQKHAIEGVKAIEYVQRPTGTQDALRAVCLQVAGCVWATAAPSVEMDARECEAIMAGEHYRACCMECGDERVRWLATLDALCADRDRLRLELEMARNDFLNSAAQTTDQMARDALFMYGDRLTLVLASKPCDPVSAPGKAMEEE